jgi:hypothetical protein
MICLIAGNLFEAERWASSQLLEPTEWFYPKSDRDLLFRKNFHVLVVGTAGYNTNPMHFERILRLAKERGKMK